MKIKLSGIGKRFKDEWIFRNLNYSLPKPGKTTVVGPNGSGKSTLLKIISAAELPTVGAVEYQTAQGHVVDAEKIFSHISFAAPYLELPEQLKLRELLKFHQKMKGFSAGIEIDFLMEEIQLKHASNKLIYHFSSGMKQRLKLGLTIFADTPVMILDEPCSNLDVAGVELYKKLMQQHSSGKTVIIGSNYNADEMLDSADQINILEYK